MIALTSTLQEIVDEFVILGPDYDPADASVTQDATTIKMIWPDTSRVRLDISVMGIQQGEVTMIVPPPIEVDGGENINNPGETGESTPADPPVLEMLTPSTIAAGGAGFQLTIDGTGFVDGSTVQFGSASGTAALASPTRVNMQVGPEGYTQAGDVPVTVTPPGGVPSNPLTFSIT